MIDRRIQGAMKRVGEEFACGGQTLRGVFRVLDPASMRSYLDDVELMGIDRPGLLLVIRGDAGIDVNDTITRDGRTYKVLKVFRHRFAGTTAVKTVVLA